MNKEIKEALYSIEDKFNNVPGNMPIVATGTPMIEVYRIVSDLLKKRDEEIQLILKKHADWKPTKGYGSEEELGYQKGLIAEAKLIQSEILSTLIIK